MIQYPGLEDPRRCNTSVLADAPGLPSPAAVPGSPGRQVLGNTACQDSWHFMSRQRLRCAQRTPSSFCIETPGRICLSNCLYIVSAGTSPGGDSATEKEAAYELLPTFLLKQILDRKRGWYPSSAAPLRSKKGALSGHTTPRDSFSSHQGLWWLL